jgi:hypothetical protein
MISYWHKNSQAAYLICCLSHLNKWQHYVVEFFQLFWGLGKGGLLSQGGSFINVLPTIKPITICAHLHWGEVCKDPFDQMGQMGHLQNYSLTHSVSHWKKIHTSQT